MKIHLIAPALPPKLNGIGDHSAHLARVLSQLGAQVTILSPQGEHADPVSNVTLKPSFSPAVRRSVWTLTDVVAADAPDWVILQYNPFSYGQRGLNLSLPRAFAAMKQRSSKTRLAMFVHEQFVPLHSFKLAIMRVWQGWQFKRLGTVADVLFTSMEVFAEQNRSRFPGKPVFHIAVGSNIPHVAIEKNEARGRLNIADDRSVIGIFGTAHNSRLLAPVRNALDAAVERGFHPVLLYIGPDGTAVRREIGNHVIIDGGALDATEVSRRLSAIDIFLGGFDDGVSTRRGSWIAGLQHGLPCVGTAGVHTDTIFRQAAADGAIVLSNPNDPHCFDRPVIELLADPAKRNAMARAGEKLFERNFTWDHLAGIMMKSMEEFSPDQPATSRRH